MCTAEEGGGAALRLKRFLGSYVYQRYVESGCCSSSSISLDALKRFIGKETPGQWPAPSVYV